MQGSFNSGATLRMQQQRVSPADSMSAPQEREPDSTSRKKRETWGARSSLAQPRIVISAFLRHCFVISCPSACYFAIARGGSATRCAVFESSPGMAPLQAESGKTRLRLVLTRKRANPGERSSIIDQKSTSHSHVYASRQLFSEARVTPPLIFGNMINSSTVTSESST